ncbi:MAG: primosomal protein [Candidatus Parcubacteria bacterium]|jgi:primosomal protein N'
MFVIEVIPLQRAVSTSSLTYYSGTDYPLGTLLRVPLRKGEVYAIVTSTKPVSAAKTALKTATFSLRKLAHQESARTLPQSLTETAEVIGKTVPAHMGAILFAMLPECIREGKHVYPKTTFHKGTADYTPQILTDTTTNRFLAYRSLVREAFAHRGSVVFVVPTSAHVAGAKQKLEIGIENRIITFSSTQTEKSLQKSLEAFDDQTSAKLIITTPAFAFLDRHDITTIIVDRSASPHFVSRSRPYLDTREVLKAYAKVTGRSILLGDTLPLATDEYKRREEIYTTHHEHSKRLAYSGSLIICEHPKKETGEEFSLTTRQLRETMSRTLESRGHVFLLAARRGIASLVTCFDCGHVFRCPDSGAPYSLLRTFRGEQEERWFISTTSGKKVRAHDTCPVCTSWRLKEQGIGIQKVYDHIQKEFPKVDVFLFDHTTATTHNKAKTIINNFTDSKKAILIGTPMAMPYIEKKVDISAVVSYEATRFVSTWRADEVVLAGLLELREITEKDVLVQTRTEVDDVLNYTQGGLIDQFYDSEIAIRASLLYPPFATFILLSWTGTKEHVLEIETIIKKFLVDVQIATYNAPHSTPLQTVRFGLIRIQDERAVSPLVEKLRQLPPYVKIQINPDQIV